jgi:hypothetical protein
MKTPGLLEAGICQKRFARFVALAGEGVVMLAQLALAWLLH